MSITDEQWASATARCTCEPELCSGGNGDCKVCDHELDPELPCPLEDDAEESA